MANGYLGEPIQKIVCFCLITVGDFIGINKWYIMNLYEILIPTANNYGQTFALKKHRQWDREVMKITSGLTVLVPAKGKWVSPDNKTLVESVIPVRIACTAEQIRKIAEFTLTYYEQLAILYYKVSSEVVILNREDIQVKKRRARLCFGHNKDKGTFNCCDRAGEYNGFASGPLSFECPESCSCHD